MITERVAARFRTKIAPVRTSCIEWIGAINMHGYGVMHRAGGTRMAHRIAWEAEYGQIPPGMDLDHFLRNDPETRDFCSTACVNTDHMRLATRSENLRGSYVRREMSRQLGLRRRKHDLPEGVTPNMSGGRKRFRAQMRLGRSIVIIGNFITPEEAHAAYLRARSKRDAT